MWEVLSGEGLVLPALWRGSTRLERSVREGGNSKGGLTLRRSRQAASIVARRPSRLALFENMCQGASEDFVPPAAQRKAVRPIRRDSRVPVDAANPSRRPGVCTCA